MQRIFSVLAVAVAVAAAGGASNAHASVCSPHPAGRHWYAEMQKTYTPRAEHGAAINIDTTSLTTGSPDSQLVTHEMWYGVTGGCEYWVEVGVLDGAALGVGSPRHAVFWADVRANGGLHVHLPAVGWRLGAYYQVKVTWAGNNSWNVYFGGVFLGTSTNNYYGGVNRCLLAGLEASRAAATDHVGGHMFGWARKARNDVWYQDWDGKSLWSDCPADIDVTTSNVTTEVLHGPN
jgi:hypothetical protein